MTQPITTIPEITTPEALTDFCASLHQTPWIAVDTEFLRVNTYYPKLCLIQIATPEGNVALIDPLAFDDLSALWALFKDPDLVKVFHSARQDLEVLALHGCLPTPIFDTQIAALFLGYGHLAGLARVVEAELNWPMTKDQTRTDWSQRPLQPDQLRYALEDVTSLAELYPRILAQLDPEQKQALEEDFALLLDPSLYQSAPEKAGYRLKALSKLGAKNQAIALKLADWRERYAIEHDRPRRWVLGDDTLIAIAKRPPKTVQALYKVPQIKPSSVREFGDSWIALIDEVFQAPDTWPVKAPKPPPALPQEEVALTLALAWRDQVTQAYGLNTGNWVGKAELLTLLRDPTPPTLLGWRRLLLEVPLRRFFDQKSTFKWTDKGLQETLS
ncbi:ribonuclease D [Hydrogenovibrio halophilus]|uniref:ribonuclease D n=1 Tax=Hydrogenovibrio halophilus TaxID=373391 RepID=UPI0006889E0E|nr:ribonuclease D [Hydrogenovibrio halophilus]